MSLDDVTLAAFADGELSAERTAQVAAAVAADPALAARVERFRAVRARLAGSLEGLSPPADILVRAQAKATSAPSRATAVGGLLAAGLAAVVLGVTLALPQSPRLSDEVAHDLRQRGPLDRALTRVASGDARRVVRGTVQPLLTVRAADGELCRAFRLVRDSRETFEGVVCRERNAWRLVALAQTATRPKGFVQASGEEAPAVAAALDSLDAGDPLPAPAERRLMDRGWRE